jgi:hypothetical protein
MTKDELKIKFLDLIRTWDETTSIDVCKSEIRSLIAWEEEFDLTNKNSDVTPYELGNLHSKNSPLPGRGGLRYNNPFMKDTAEWSDYIEGFTGK